MFAFLKSGQEFRLGLEIESDRWVAVMLDGQGEVQERREVPASQEVTASALKELLSGFPLKQCQLVMSLPYGAYNCKTVDSVLNDQKSVGFEAERWLPYQISEACFAWHPLPQGATFVTAYPDESLVKLSQLLKPLGLRSVAWEAREMVYWRTLEQAGLPGLLLDLVPNHWFRIASAAQEHFYFVGLALTGTEKITFQEQLQRVLDYLTSRRRMIPEYLWVHAPSERLADFSDWDCRQLPPDFMAIGLAQSPPGRHQLRLT